MSIYKAHISTPHDTQDIYMFITPAHQAQLSFLKPSQLPSEHTCTAQPQLHVKHSWANQTHHLLCPDR